MPIIPTPEQARKLRAEFDGNPIIDELEIDLREHGATSAYGAAALMQSTVFNVDLTARERDAVIARFVHVVDDDEAVDEPVDELASCPDCECCSLYQCASGACDVDGFGCSCTGGVM